MAIVVDPGSTMAPGWGARVQFCSNLLAHASWPSLVCLGAFVCGLAWLGWKHWANVAEWLRIYRTVTTSIDLTDPHGLHMRRCKDLVELARKYVGYRIFIRCPTARAKTWANARSIISLQMLGVRGPAKGEKPPVLEVRVHGFRPKKLIQEIDLLLGADPQKYLSPYELYELAKATGGELAVKPPEKRRTFWERTIQFPFRLALSVRALGSSLGKTTISPGSKTSSSSSSSTSPTPVSGVEPPSKKRDAEISPPREAHNSIHRLRPFSFKTVCKPGASTDAHRTGEAGHPLS
jgi:phosphotransferase system HPr-like phosphotransfer protein